MHLHRERQWAVRRTWSLKGALLASVGSALALCLLEWSIYVSLG